LAELLGFERSSLAGIISEEAANNGDFKTALLLCKVGDIYIHYQFVLIKSK
jgi:hypothetical protein